MAREPGARKTDSVFDFMYADHRRIALFLSQFSDFGNITNLVHTHSVGGDTSLSGGVPGVAAAEGKQSHQTALARHFDPQWLQALNFLDEVQARGMLRRGMDEAHMGGLFLVSGSLYLMNMRTFARTWDVAAEANAAPATEVTSRQQKRAAKRRSPEPAEDMSGLRILGSLDQPVFMVFRAEGKRLWSTLDPDYLTGGSDVNWKHGLKVPGEWHLLAILDCPPGSGDVESSEIGRISGGGDNIFSDQSIVVWREFRMILGRPDDCYGVTPLVIMREVS